MRVESVTPASSKLVRSVSRWLARRTNGQAASAPVPSPSCMERSSKGGGHPSASKIKSWPVIAERWAQIRESVTALSILCAMRAAALTGTPSMMITTPLAAASRIPPTIAAISNPPKASRTPRGDRSRCTVNDRLITATLPSSSASLRPLPFPVTWLGSLSRRALAMALALVVLPTPISPKMMTSQPSLIASRVHRRPASIADLHSASVMARSYRKFRVPRLTL